jgi:Ca2+-binding EF-hand superfamily protein
MKKKERKPSSVFSMFDEKQVQKFKAAFDVIDANNDGYIDKDDLLKTYEAFGIF